MARAQRKLNTAVPRKKMLKAAPPPAEAEWSIWREGGCVLLLVLAVFLAVSLYSHLSAQVASGAGEEIKNSMGHLGGLVSAKLFDLLGWCAFVTVLWVLLLARLLSKEEKSGGSATFIFTMLFSSVVVAGACATIASVIFGYEGGGFVGSRLAFYLIAYVNEAGALLISLALLFLSFASATGVGVKELSKGLVRVGSGGGAGLLDAAYVLKQASATGAGAVGRASRGMLPKLENLRIRTKDSLADSDEEGADEQELEEKPRRRKAKSKPIIEEDFGEEDFDEDDEDEDDDEEDLQSSEISPPKIYRGQDAVAAESLSEKARRIRGAAKTKSLATKKLGEKSTATQERTQQELRAQKPFELPALQYLVPGDSQTTLGPKDEDLIENSRRLEQALRNFRLGGRVVEVHPGPVVTLYQFEPAAGIKVQRIINLADDLALALKVESVRVYAPVPGKGTVGIEVPNAHREIVRLRDVIESEEFQSRSHALALALGKNTYGEPFVADLAKMPHLLIAGATGTGKSVCINALLVSLLYRNTPQDLRLIMIDPKMLELSVYEGIPHLKAPVVTNAKRARGVLWWAVEEMERRYSLMKELGVRDVSMYNRSIVERQQSLRPIEKKKKDAIITLEEKDVVATSSAETPLSRGDDWELGHVGIPATHELEVMPRIVIIVDELADLMLTVGREIEELLTRLAQKARAAGIHLILATQRPSVNVITGLIKANFPARVSFKVASKIDARTVMDSSGAERLLGQGDMLFLSPSVGKVKRLHSPYVSDKEVHDVVRAVCAQGAPDYDSAIEQAIKKLDQAEQASEGGMPSDFQEFDPLYDQAVQIVLEKGQASTSMVQRVFRIGYNRAARILETMEREGIVGPADGAKPRQILISGSL